MITTEVINRFSERIGDLGQLVLAGGAVRDELMGRKPKDFDLFLLYHGRWDFEHIKDELGKRVQVFPIQTPKLEWHKSEPYLISNFYFEDWGCDVQLLANPAASPEALLDTFDWSICLFARTTDRLIQFTALDEIGPGKELKLHNITFPLSTLRRGFRFSERFQMKLRHEDVTSLCREIVRNADKKIGSGSGNEPDMPALAANVLINESA